MKFVFLLFVLTLTSPVFALDREAVSIINYDLDIQIDSSQQRLGARGKITLRNDSGAPQKVVALQISSTLDWRSIQVGDKPVDFTSHPYASDIDHSGSLTEAVITLPTELSPKATIDLQIGYEGTIPADVTRLTRIGVPENTAIQSDWDEISSQFTAVRGIGYVVWYPVATESANLSDGNTVFETLNRWKAREAGASLDFRLIHSGGDTGQTILCNGRSSKKSQDPSTVECNYAPAEFPLFVIGNLATEERSGLTIEYTSEHRSGADAYALAAELASQLVNDWFGKPKENITIIDLVDAGRAPYESAALLMIPLAGNDSKVYQMTAVHELTHSAFFSPRPWIYEGVAHFAQALMREQQDERASAVSFMDGHRSAIADAEKMAARDKDGQTKESLINTDNEEFYRSKAMYVWWMLRDMVGDVPLKKALASYRPEQDKESGYMQRLIENESKRDLEWFFDDWVYRDRGLPDFKVESVYSRATVNGGYVLTITIENLGDAGAEVPVRVLMQDAPEAAKRLEVRGKSKASVRIEAVTAPQEVIVNDGSVPESDYSNNDYKIQNLDQK